MQPPTGSMLGVNNAGLVVVALAFGVVADALLRVTPWGLNVFLVTICGIATALAVSRNSHIELTGEGRYLVIASIFFAAALVWRDSPTLDDGQHLRTTGRHHVGGTNGTCRP